MVAVVGLATSRTTMLLLQEVGADGLADESTLVDTLATSPKARQETPETMSPWLYT
jgi:hypothetical protein